MGSWFARVRTSLAYVLHFVRKVKDFQKYPTQASLIRNTSINCISMFGIYKVCRWNWLFNLTEVVDDDRGARRKVKDVFKNYSKAAGLLAKLVPKE